MMSTTNLDQYNLSARARNRLFQHGIITLEDLQKLSLDELASWDKVGVKTVEEIRKFQQLTANSEITVNCSVPSERKDTAGKNTENEKKKYSFSEEQIEELTLHDISELNLSVRAFNCLSRAGKTTIFDVIGAIQNDFSGIHNLGIKTGSEIIQSVDQWISNNLLPFLSQDPQLDDNSEEVQYFQKIKNSIAPIMPVSTATLIRSAKDSNLFDYITAGGYMSITMENYRAVLDLPELQRGIKQLFLKIIPHGIVASKNLRSEIEKYPIDIPAEVLEDKFFDCPDLTNNTNYCYVTRPTITSYIQEEMDAPYNRKYAMFTERLKGKTLQEIAEMFGVTRERVRQIVQKIVNRMPLLFDDYLSELFMYFSLSKDEFLQIFPKASTASYEYLNIRYKKGTLPISRDSVHAYTGIFKERFEKAVLIQESRSLSREQISLLVLIENQDRAMSVDEFVKAYKEYTYRNNLLAEQQQVNIRTLLNFLRGAKNIVFNANSCIRYCQADVELIWKSIQFTSYNDSVISSELLFRDYSDLMESQDIRDGYELFYILKSSSNNAIESNWINPSLRVSFRRVPIMIIGNGDEELQAIKLLQAISPVSFEDFFAAYEDLYGVRRDTAPGNPHLTEPLSKYYVNGKYIIDVPAIDPRDVPNLLNALKVKSLWFMDELEQLLLKCCSYTSLKSLNVAAFKRIGYILNSSYAFKETYGSMIGYLNTEIFSNKVVDLAILDPRLLHLNAFSSTLDKKRFDLEYIDVAPRVLMSFDEVSKRYNISIEEARQLQQLVCTCATEKYFNAHTLLSGILQNNPVAQKLKDNEWLLSCILRAQSEVVTMRVTGGHILTKDRNSFRLSSVLEWYCSKFGKMDLTTLTNSFNQYFSIAVTRNRIAEKLRAGNNWDNCVTDSLDEYVEVLLAENMDQEDDDFFKEEFF